jgi:moderate conductance mechanosensitive channel
MEASILDSITRPNLHEELVKSLDKLISWALVSGIKIVLIVGTAWLLKIIAKRFIQRIVKAAVHSDKLQMEDAEIKRMNTLVHIFNWTINTIIVIIASMMVLQEFGVKIAPILASAGIVGVAIGFGGQYLVRDVITGFFIILENQYRIGDVVTIEGLSGSVEDISLRVTTLRDANGTVHYIPHGEIKKVSNCAKQFARINLNVGVSYDTNIEYAKQVINRIGQELANDPVWKNDINIAPAFLRVESLDDSSVSLKIMGETKPLRQWDVSGELLKRIKETFEQEGIEIPFPQRVIRHIGEKGLDDTGV